MEARGAAVAEEVQDTEDGAEATLVVDGTTMVAAGTRRRTNQETATTSKAAAAGAMVLDGMATLAMSAKARDMVWQPAAGTMAARVPPMTAQQLESWAL